MASQVSLRSDWRETPAQSGQVEKQGPRGAGWLIAALYIFSAVVFASWFAPWGADSAQTAAPPPQHQHSIHGPQG
jgi:hypothetical protein